MEVKWVYKNKNSMFNDFTIIGCIFDSLAEMA